MEFGSDIHGAQMVNPNDFGDLQTFPLVPPASHSSHLFSETSKYLQVDLAHNFVQTFTVSHQLNHNNFSDPLTFL